MPAFPSQWLGLKAQRLFAQWIFRATMLRSKFWSVLFCIYQKIRRAEHGGACLEFLVMSGEVKARGSLEPRRLSLAWATN